VGKIKFLNTLRDLWIDLDCDEHYLTVQTVIECCAILAEENTNDSGEYNVGKEIAEMLREVARDYR
jgi:hypothetical protein